MVGADVRFQAASEPHGQVLLEMVPPGPIPLHRRDVHFSRGSQPAAHPRFVDLLRDLSSNVLWAQQLVTVAEPASDDAPQLVLVARAS